MIAMNKLFGEVKCINDDASCVLDGERARRVMFVGGFSGENTIAIRAFTFKNGEGGGGGGERQGA